MIPHTPSPSAEAKAKGPGQWATWAWRTPSAARRESETIIGPLRSERAARFVSEHQGRSELKQALRAFPE